MSIILVPADIYSAETSTFHLSEDNARISQLNNNDAVLASAINTLQATITSGAGGIYSSGNWSSLSLAIPTSVFNNIGSFSIRANILAIEDTTTTSSNMLYTDQLIFGYFNGSVVSNVLSYRIATQITGSKVPVMSVVLNSGIILITVSNFSGANGKLACRPGILS